MNGARVLARAAFTAALLLAPLAVLHAAATKKPNIVFILADDLGYGDVGCYNPASKVPTPNLDQLAREGMRFTDAHSPSTVCTPSRYSLLTGQMDFRINYRGVFTGAGGPCLITEKQLTLPQMLRNQGYATAMTGKWHIGLSFLDKDGKRITQNGVEGVKRIDYSRTIPDAPIYRGFDRFYGTANCPGTDFLYAFIEGDRIPVPPSGMLDKTHLPQHPYSHDNREGLIAPGYDLEELDMVFLKKSRAFLEEHVREHPEQPFFLHHCTAAVHLPSFAARQFQGSTKAGPHGDFIFEFDYVVGELMKTLAKLGVADNTVVMVSSDNGAEVTSVLHMRADYGHDGVRPWRGFKRDNWEGGHRIPFIVRWPGKVTPGSTSDQTVCLTDVMATCAAITGATLPSNAAEDSFSLLPVLLGQARDEPVRPYTLHQTPSLALAIRKGPWKYLDHQGSGGNNYDKGPLKLVANPNNAPTAPGQLYNLDRDPGETNNLYFQHPEAVRRLKEQLERTESAGRSRPAAALPTAICAAEPAAKPNIVILLADQWRAAATGYAGDPNVKTPALDRLAAEGIWFHNAVSVCPVCTPYRAALMTGRYPTSTGMFLNDLYLPASELCMAEILKGAGYTTAYIGKWHLDGHGRQSYIPPERRQGWEYWKAAECDHSYNHSHYYAGTSSEKKFWDGYDAFAQTKDAAEYIRQHARRGHRFALMVAYGPPHFPHDTAPQAYKDLYPPEKIQLPPNVPEAMPQQAQREAQGYYAHCTALDKCVGDVLAVLRETALEENTIVLFTADHGEMLGAHGCPPRMKQQPWDEAAHVPLLVRYPAAHGRRGRAVQTPLTTPDILPTLLGLAGVAIPATIEGEDLSPLVRGGAEQPDRAALYMGVAPFAGSGFNKEYRAVRTSRYTYVRGLEGPWLLFDDTKDPYQMTNLSAVPEHAATVRQWDDRLQAALRKIGDPFRPAAYYIKQWGLPVAPGQSIPYGPGARPQTPQRLHRIDPQTPQGLQDLFKHTGDPLPLVSAHRGGAEKNFPENCLATFENTLKHTFAVMEIDPRYAKDGAIVLHHDATLERTTTGKGRIADFTLRELKELRLKDNEGTVTEFQIPTLDEALEWARGKTVLVLDQKDVPVAARVQKIAEHKAEAFAMLIVFSFKDAQACYAMNPNIMMEVMVPSREKVVDFDKTGVPWRNVVAFVGHTPPPDATLYALIHAKGSSCMVGSSRNLDRQLLGKQAADGKLIEQDYRALLRRGADLIETDLPSQVGPMLYGTSPVPSCKKRYFSGE